MAFDLTKLITWSAGFIPTATNLNDGLTKLIRASGGPRTTSLPGSPVDEDMWIYPADTTNGVLWPLKYNAGSASAYKWEAAGGGYVFATVAADESTASTTYVDLTTTGPSITVPRAGDYEVFWEANAWNATGGIIMYAGVKKGAAAIAATDEMTWGADAAATPGTTRSKRVVLTGLAASDVIKVQYKTSAGTAHFLNRGLFVRPVRVS